MAAFGFLLAIAPGIVAWWTGRSVVGHTDDPALPELLLARQNRLASATTTCMVVILVFAGGHLLWAMPLLLLGVLLAQFPVRRSLFGETWSRLDYIRYKARSLVAALGSVILVCLAPSAILSIVTAWIPADDTAWRLTLAGALGLVLGALIVLSQRYFPELWLHLYRAEPYDASDRPDLRSRLDAILERATPKLHKRPALHRFGPRGAHEMQAVAIPSLRFPAVAMSRTLLELLNDAEVAAVFAHEVAHHEHYNPSRLRRMRRNSYVASALAIALPLLLLWANLTSMLVLASSLFILLMLLTFMRTVANRRKHETESDLRAVALCGDPEALISALSKLHIYSRMPRRWPREFEQNATHPSLVRRIQAIRESAPTTTIAANAPFAGPTILRSTTAGAFVALDDKRVYWLEGVPAGSALELPALQQAAASYRVHAYAELTELRVTASGNDRALRATDRSGQSWSVPIESQDVANAQRTLDVVDIRVSPAQPQNGLVRPANRTAVTALTLVLLVSLSATAGTGLAALPGLLVLFFPSPSSLAALGALVFTRTLLQLGSVGSVGSLEKPWWIVVIALALAFAGLAWRHRTFVARKWWSGPWVVVGLLALVLVVQVLSFGDSISGIVPTLAAIGAALAILPLRRWRLVGSGTIAVAVVGGAAVSAPGAFTPRREPATCDSCFVKTAEVRLTGHVQELALSPSGARYVVATLSTRGNREPVSRYTAGTISSAGDTIRVATQNIGPAQDVAFAADDSLLVLSWTETDSLELRLFRLADSTLDVAWRVALPAIAAANLYVDRSGARWIVVGSDQDEQGLIISATGGFDGSGAATSRISTGGLIGIPVAPFADGTVLASVFPTSRGEPTFLSIIPMLTGSFAWRQQLWRFHQGSAKGDSLGTGFGVLSCASAIARDVAFCIDINGKRSRLWRVRANGHADTLATVSGIGRHLSADDPSQIVVSTALEGRIAVVDSRNGRAVYVPILPKALQASGEFMSDVAAAPGRIAVVSTSTTGTRLILYRGR